MEEARDERKFDTTEPRWDRLARLSPRSVARMDKYRAYQSVPGMNTVPASGNNTVIAPQLLPSPDSGRRCPPV
jgi:hypothetical protein